MGEINGWIGIERLFHNTKKRLMPTRCSSATGQSFTSNSDAFILLNAKTDSSFASDSIHSTKKTPPTAHSE